MSERIEIRKSAWAQVWNWYCPVCHYGENLPGRDVATFECAWADVDFHLSLHRVTGKRLEWAVVS